MPQCTPIQHNKKEEKEALGWLIVTSGQLFTPPAQNTGGSVMISRWPFLPRAWQLLTGPG
jgi:hypothetical protein